MGFDCKFVSITSTDQDFFSFLFTENDLLLSLQEFQWNKLNINAVQFSWFVAVIFVVKYRPLFGLIKSENYAVVISNRLQLIKMLLMWNCHLIYCC